jgi:hypothetical protein
VGKLFVRASNWILAGNCAALHTTETRNDFKLKKDAKEIKLHRIAKAYDFWRCSRAAKTYLRHRWDLTPKTSKWQPEDTFHIWKISAKVSLLNIQYLGAAVCKLSERLPLPPAMSANTPLEDRLKCSNSAKSEKSNVIDLNVIGITHPKHYCNGQMAELEY